MTTLDRLIPVPRLVETDRITVAAPPAVAWSHARYANLAGSRAIRALFAIRTILGRRTGEGGQPAMFVDDMVSSPERPGFQVLVENPFEVAVGAIGQVWRLVIPFVHVRGPAEFAAFDRPDYVKVAWAIRVVPEGAGASIEVEVRVDATDDASWRKFQRYFHIIGIGSRFIRRSTLRALARELDAAPIDKGAVMG